MEDNTTINNAGTQQKTKFCKHCGAKIPEAAVICTYCGCQVEELSYNNNQPSIVINNTNPNVNSNFNSNVNANVNSNRPVYVGHVKNKWVAFLLCFFLGFLGAHKFYEGKAGMGILYLFTCGLFGIGWFVDCIVLLCKPNPYYV